MYRSSVISLNMDDNQDLTDDDLAPNFTDFPVQVAQFEKNRRQ
jgi:hypothetical protein